MSANALYYPWIDPPNRVTLNTSVLYWDRLFTIVPASIPEPYENQWTKVARDLGFLRPRFVDPDCLEVRKASEEFQEDFNRKAITSDMRNARRHSRLHLDKMAHSLHPMKVSDELRHRLWGKKRPDDDGFYRIAGGYASAYMSRLAAVVSENDELAPCTDRRLSRDVVVDRFASRNHCDVVSQNEALLASLSIQSIRISPRISFSKLIRFRDEHYDELVRYRKAVHTLARQAAGISDEGFREKELKRIAKEELNPAHEVVGARLHEAGFDFGLAALHVSMTAAVGYAASGFKSHWAAAGSALVGLAFSVVKWRLAKEKVRKEPLTYFANLRRQFHEEQNG